VIINFKCKKTKQLFDREKIPKEFKNFYRVALRKLVQIHASEDVNDLKVPPGNRLEVLAGNRKGQYSIRINSQYRVCFEFRNNNAYEVEIVDYHK